ncbi:rRNA adenine N-6-methyltransferase family protein [Cardiobacterium hominis]|uniref:ribosomal RNA small subunit methyltransferase A n=1 Tax=Cardiobacterium hominis TaxID=2718 RepID=UPI00370DD444
MNEVKAAKHLGQHFLRDEAVIARLLAVINAKAGERILEIGPGLGALTLPLLRQTGAMTAVEYDPRVLAPLAKKAATLGTLHLIHADILTIDFGELLAKQPPPPVGEGRGGGSDQPASATSTPPSPRAGGAGSGVHPHTAAAESVATHRVRLGAPQAAEIITAPHSSTDLPPPPQSGGGLGRGCENLRSDNPQKLRLVGNLPYNLSSPILFHCLAQRQHIHDMHYMLQKEVVDRITAAPGSKTYGRLSLMAQLWCETTALFDIPPDAFDPPPKVDSAVVRLVPRPAPAWQIDDLATFDETVRLAFAQRRKMLRKTFAHWMNAAALEALDIDPTARAETLDGAAFARLANAHYQQERQK